MSLPSKLSKYSHEEIKQILNNAATKQEACKILDISRQRLNVYFKNLCKPKKIKSKKTVVELIDNSHFNEISEQEALRSFNQRFKAEKRARMLRELKDPYYYY